MKNEFVSKAFDESIHDRSLVFDELNDGIEAGIYSESEVDEITLAILDALPSEKNESIHESMMNILSGIYLSSNHSKDIEKYVINHINSMKKNSIVHALSIISESNIKEKSDIVSTFVSYENKCISDLATEYLSIINRKS
jgi:hypothetical protein